MTDKPHPIELWDVAKLIPYPENAKKHSDEQVQKLAALIKRFGWTQPIVVDADGVIIAGHGRRLAAIFLGLVRVPVICRRDLSKAEADGLRLADNRVTSVDYDQAAIQIELQRLYEIEGFEITDLGFDQKEIDFSVGDLAVMDDSFFTEDVSQAVEKQKTENAEKIQATDDIAAPIADAFGFKRVSIAQSRTIRELMTRLEAKTGEVGAEALISFISDALDRK